MNELFDSLNDCSCVHDDRSGKVPAKCMLWKSICWVQTAEVRQISFEIVPLSNVEYTLRSVSDDKVPILSGMVPLRVVANT